MDTKKLTASSSSSSSSSQTRQNSDVMNVFDDLDKKELSVEATEGDYAAFADEVTKWLSEIEMSDDNNNDNDDDVKDHKNQVLKDQPMSEDVDY